VGRAVHAGEVLDQVPDGVQFVEIEGGVLTAAISSRIAFLPSAKYISVLSAAKSGLGMPAKPGLRLRLTTTTVRALSTSRIGMPAIGLVGSVRARGSRRRWRR
jgi:hypothetical protein